jgi:hypothetical protein
MHSPAKVMKPTARSDGRRNARDSQPSRAVPRRLRKPKSVARRGAELK